MIRPVRTQTHDILNLPLETYTAMRRRFATAGALERCLLTDTDGREGLLVGPVLFKPDEVIKQTDSSVAKLKRGDDTPYDDPLDMLSDLRETIEAGHLTPNKVLILMLDDTGEAYQQNWFQAGMKYSEMIALCHISAQKFLAAMQFCCGGDK